MESSWCNVSQGKVYVSNPESVSFSDMVRCCFGPEVEARQMIAKQLPSPSSGSDAVTDRFGIGGDMTPIISSLTAFSEEEDSGSKFSSSMADSNSRDSLVDLKLGGFSHVKDRHSSSFFHGGPVLSTESSAPAKRPRAGAINSRTAYCQVYGCNKDLRSSKDYHKRHKVCEPHSKTAKVIVNGVEHRFCQQCSRFHLLSEFDDGKRSCRRRLASHNERRRKPHPGRAGKLLQPSFGDKFHGSAFASTSFIWPGRMHFDPEKYGVCDVYGRRKLEDRADYGCPLMASPLPSNHLQSKSESRISAYTNHERWFPFAYEAGLSSSTSSADGQMPQISVLRSFFQESPLGSEDISAFNTASALPGISGSGCALSLLSSPSQNSPYSSSQVSNKLMDDVPNKLPTSSMMSPGEGYQRSPVLISSCAQTNNFEISEGMLQAERFLQGKGSHSFDNGPTISLKQLSSQLKRRASETIYAGEA